MPKKIPSNFKLASSPLFAAMLLVGCGGGGSTTPDSTTLDAGAAAGADNEVVEPVGFAVSGRVADGYIVGATVCVDINENEACDDDEPSAITRAGGSYDLAVPVDAADKPILAVIPADAIDEDTGAEVGSKLVFSAPAERPEFLSPLTTLIHQELKGNPALKVDDAERNVKKVLGLEDDAAVSLFADYVANADKPSDFDDRAEKYEYLHDTARVIASMMKDIEAQVETAATDEGVDVEGDQKTQQAIRQLVRAEVRELLPEIAQRVANIVSSSSSESDGVQDQTTEEFDPDEIALALRPDDAGDKIEERIDAIRNKGDIERVDMKSILTAGVYSIDIDCGYHGYEYQPSPEVEKPGVLADEVYIEGQPNYKDPDCEGKYNVVKLTDAGNELMQTEYQYDAESGEWELSSEREEITADYGLVDGEWIMVDEISPEGAVRFTDDGGAVISNDSGEMTVKGATEVLDGMRVRHHLWENANSPLWLEATDPSTVFESEADAYHLRIAQSLPAHVMFNIQPPLDNDQACAEFNNNCNVVHAWQDGGQIAQTSLAGIQEAALYYTKLVGLGRNGGPDLASAVKLTADATDDGELATEGEVYWYFDFGQDTIRPAPGVEPIKECYVDHEPLDKPVFENGQKIPDGQDPLVTEPLAGAALPEDSNGEGIVESENQDPIYEACDPALTKDEVLPAVEKRLADKEVEDTEPAYELPLTSEWRVISVDGIDMIEIDMPLRLRHSDAVESEQALLLVEHEGYVRLGARLPGEIADSVTTYNNAAFETLKAVAQGALGSK